MMRSKMEIILEDGKWLLNGNPYEELIGIEKLFFEEFLVAMRLTIEQEKNE